MNKFKIIKIFIIIPIFFCFFNFANAEKKGIGVNKTIFSFESQFGEEKEFNLSIKNLFSTEQKIEVETGSFEVGDNNQIIFLNKENEKNISSWFLLEENNFKLNPDEEKTISVKIKIPENVKGGNYQGILFFKLIPNEKKNNSVNENGAIGVQFLINVLSYKKIGTGKIENFKKPIFLGNNLNLNFSFKNTGNFYYSSVGEVNIKNLLTGNKEKAVLDNHFLFPEKKFDFVIDKKGFFWLGIYKISLFFVDGEGNLYKKESLVFGYFFVLLFFLSGFLFIYFWVRRKRVVWLRKRIFNRKNLI